jgi:hypothetical protein
MAGGLLFEGGGPPIEEPIKLYVAGEQRRDWDRCDQLPPLPIPIMKGLINERRMHNYRLGLEALHR